VFETVRCLRCRGVLAYAGIGYETAKVLLAKGYNVTLACRDASRASNAVQKLQQQQPGALVDYLLLDLADLASVRDAANKWMDSGKQIDVLLNNAGVASVKLYGII
jgi:NAD(P)-dependent dehydrogenase (short-subunit alcohol dehydrogenase family)